MDMSRLEGFDNSAPLVTFVIPSIGRPTIDRALTSILSQKNSNWRVLIVYDGVPESHTIKDPRIEWIRSEKQGSAGATRNSALPKIQTEWIAFLDDDDAVSSDYVDRLLEMSAVTPAPDIVVFRMKFVSNGTILPSLQSSASLQKSFVGISFAIRKDVFADVPFKPVHAEDFYLLQDAHQAGKTILLSKYLTYAIRPSDNDVGNPAFWETYKNTQGSQHIIDSVTE
jgi:glycosyltransferase involved in cell wall biosynthesis